MAQRQDTAASQAAPRKGLLYSLAALVVLVGLGARIYLASIAPRWGYLWDHFDNIGFGRTAARNGLLRVYSVERKDLATVRGQVWDAGNNAFVDMERRSVVLPNYPPLAMTIFYLESGLLEAIDSPLKANTFPARMVMAIAPILFELAAAVGVMLLAWHVAGRRAGLIAGAILWLLPPVAMNGAFWGQSDGLFLAPAAFVMVFLLRRRWLAAGLCLGLAAALKPQAVLLGPVVLYAAAAVGEPSSRVTLALVARRLGVVVGAAAGAVLILTLPWLIVDGPAWVERSYVWNITKAYPITTMKAFNVWYVDAMLLDGQVIFALDSQDTILGVSKDAWGRILLLGATVAIAIFCWKRYRREPRGLILFAGLLLWSAFVLPTRVHERYVIYCIPLVIVAAVSMRRYWPALIGLAIVAAAEHSHTAWMKGPPAGMLMGYRHVVERKYESYLADYKRRAARIPPDRRPKPLTLDGYLRVYAERTEETRPEYLRLRAGVVPWEISLVAISLLAYGWAAAAAFWPSRAGKPPDRPAPKRRRRRPKR